jgi:hypothetical protein
MPFLYHSRRLDAPFFNGLLNESAAGRAARLPETRIRGSRPFRRPCIRARCAPSPRPQQGNLACVRPTRGGSLCFTQGGNGGVTREQMEDLYGAKITPANSIDETPKNPFDPIKQSHEYELFANSPEDLQTNILQARANPGESFQTIDWVADPRASYIQQTRASLLAAAKRDGILSEAWVRTSGLHSGPQIRFGHVHLTYDDIGTRLAPFVHWDSVDPVHSLTGHIMRDVLPSWWRQL